MRRLLGHVHRSIGHSSAVTEIAVKLRNQANALVSAHFSGIESPAENGEYALIDRVAPAALNFIDVGANAGHWSARFKERMRLSGSGLAVDANAQCIEALRKRFGGEASVKILDAALSDYCGTATFFQGADTASALSSFTNVALGVGTMTPRVVSVSTLDQEVAILGWDNVSMLKIDAEGHDFFVLRGARDLLSKKRIDFIQFECNSAWNAVGVSIVAAASYLEGLGYRMYQLQPDRLRAIDVRHYRECGDANWVALHDGSPDVGLEIIGEPGHLRNGIR